MMIKKLKTSIPRDKKLMDNPNNLTIASYIASFIYYITLYQTTFACEIFF